MVAVLPVPDNPSTITVHEKSSGAASTSCRSASAHASTRSRAADQMTGARGRARNLHMDRRRRQRPPDPKLRTHVRASHAQPLTNLCQLIQALAVGGSARGLAQMNALGHTQAVHELHVRSEGDDAQACPRCACKLGVLLHRPQTRAPAPPPLDASACAPAAAWSCGWGT